MPVARFRPLRFRTDSPAVLGSEAWLLISAGTLAEALVVASNRGIRAEMAMLVAEGGVEVVPATTAARVAEAYAA